jgi:hypothetical protein
MSRTISLLAGATLSGAILAGCLSPVSKGHAVAKSKSVDLKGIFKEDWLDLDENSDAPKPSQMKLDDDIVGTFYQDGYPDGGYAFTYGGKTAQKPLMSTTDGNSGVWAVYFDNEWAGADVSIGNGRYMDLTPFRKTGSLTFWIKPGVGSQKFLVGLIDNQGGEKKVQTKVACDAYVVLKAGEWKQVRIPLKAFMDDGSYWDAKAGREFPSKMDWSKIQEFRLSIGKDENKVAAGKPIAFYMDQVQITKTSKGIYDPDAFWEAFKSSEPDKLVTDFTKWVDGWKSQHGTSADLKVAIAPLPKGAPESVKGQSLRVDFKPGDWFDAFFQTPGFPEVTKDWSKHYGLLVWLYTDKPYQSFDFVIQDRDHEMFLTKVGAGRGWNQILIPFRNFNKFPYYQPPEAKQNNLLDLDGIFQMGIKPGGEIAGTLSLAKLELTNLREVPKVVQPGELPAQFKGSLTKSVQKIPDIHGINVGMWAPELMDEASIKLHKAAKWGSVRYPGGLRSDWEDWEKTLKDKDFNIDTDEFLDWCAEVNCQPMFTANVGDGTPAQAARWVEYVNKKRKGPRVQNWEIGNEIYGDWHKYYEKWGKDGGIAYGKAVREYVKAMKAVDPDIKITVVWRLGGEWNKNVFQQVADLIDGVNVHHYAQTSGSESDPGLLSVSQESDVLMQEVRKQVDEYGVKGRKYDIWLSEWNSVDFNPGPQILQHVEALFVADYLGHLAKAPIQIANLWALYNGRDKRMGDNGVLGCSSDPKGLNHRNPSYWAMLMMSNALNGTLMEGSSDHEMLQNWIAKRDDGKVSLVFVNKNPETDYKTTLHVPGLKGEAIVEILTSENSGGLKSNEPTGAVNDDRGPESKTMSLADGSTLVVPKYSVVTVRFQ